MAIQRCSKCESMIPEHSPGEARRIASHLPDIFETDSGWSLKWNKWSPRDPFYLSCGCLSTGYWSANHAEPVDGYADLDGNPTGLSLLSYPNTDEYRSFYHEGMPFHYGECRVDSLRSLALRAMEVGLNGLSREILGEMLIHGELFTESVLHLSSSPYKDDPATIGYGVSPVRL